MAHGPELAPELPSALICATFSAMAGPLSDQVQDNTREAQPRSVLRDTPLPKLLFGRFRL